MCIYADSQAMIRFKQEMVELLISDTDSNYEADKMAR